MNNNSWYQFDANKLSDRQKGYVKALSVLFKVQFADKEWRNYKPLPYQIEYHSQSLLALEHKAKNRFAIKSRNTSFTTSTMIDLIMCALKYPDTLIPVIGQDARASIDIVKDTKNIIEHMNPTTILKPYDCEFLEKEARFPNGSVIRAYPSSVNAESLRSRRLITGLLDEIAVQRNFKEIFTAIMGASSGEYEGKSFFQLNMGTTLKGRIAEYYALFEKAKKYKITKTDDIGIELFEFPVFDPNKFIPSKNILEQNLIPIAPWHSLQELEYKRTEDLATFLSEYMCIPLDDSGNYITFESILEAQDQNLHNEIIKTSYPLIGGFDVAAEHDFCALVVFEKINELYLMRWCEVFKPPINLTEMQKYLVDFINENNITLFRIDKTGIGTQMGQYLKGALGSKIEPIHFSERAEDKQKINEKMAIELKQLFIDKRIKIQNNIMLQKHLLGVKMDLKSEHSSDGHCDLFWACALATLRNEKKNTKSIGYFAIAKR